MSFDNILHFVKKSIIGGGGDALDGIDVTDPAFVIGSICRVYENNAGVRSVRFYVSEDSGATADDDTIVIPAGGYSGNIRWHLYGATGSNGVAEVFSPPFLNIANGKTNLIIRRFTLAAGEQFTINRLEISKSDGSTDANLSIDVAESTDGGSTWTSLTSTSSISTTTVISTAGAIIAYRITNNTGVAVDAAVTVTGGTI